MAPGITKTYIGINDANYFKFYLLKTHNFIIKKELKDIIFIDYKIVTTTHNRFNNNLSFSKRHNITTFFYSHWFLTLSQLHSSVNHFCRDPALENNWVLARQIRTHVYSWLKTGIKSYCCESNMSLYEWRDSWNHSFD